MDYSAIKKVHVVYKTHLDIGFTDMGSRVTERYVKEYIPHSVKLAMELNTEKDKKFIWTLGSFMIDYYLKHAEPEAVELLERAVGRGDICWHGIACTTHTELLDRDLLNYSLDIGKHLDERFGRTTIASKMTDVPGHTRGLIAPLCDHGIRYLHIGVNASSMVPEVPDTFLWKQGNREIVVQYSGTYGAPGYVEGMDEVLEFAHTGDNLGPQSAEAIEKEFDRIRGLYPNARVVASTLDAYAESLWEKKGLLPVVEEEIGDSWIHGIASDPWKTTRYRELLRLKDRWVQQGVLTPGQKECEEFFMNLMLVAEHTWGLDFKKYLADFKNWTKDDFQRARREDTTTLDFLTYRNASMLDILNTDFKNYRGGVFTGSYAYYESSHQEQRDYLEKAVEALPDSLKAEARMALDRMTPVETGHEGACVRLGETVTVKGWSVKIDGSGAVCSLKKDGRAWIKDGEAGRLQYQTFSAVDCVDNYYRYNRDFYETYGWSEGDFSKPGLEFVEDLENRCYDFYAETVTKKDDTLLISVRGDEEAVRKYGCPAKAQILYQFDENEVRCTLKWFQKDANKMPEALWFHYQFDVENPYRWMMRKLGEAVSPFDVVKGGNRKQHCVEAMEYRGADGSVTVENIHAPLVSIGGRNLYEMDQKTDSLENGFYFNLFNNRWGTNFSMWCEDECQFEFLLKIQTASASRRKCALYSA